MILNVKQKYLMDIIVGCKTSINGKTKQGAVHFDAGSLLELLENNQDVIKHLEETYDFTLSYQEVSDLLAENSCNVEDDLEVQYKKLFTKVKSKYKLNKTPGEVFRNIIIKLLMEITSFTSKESKTIVKEKFVSEYAHRPADLYKYQGVGKDPVDQIITNPISSNLINKVNSLVFVQEPIEGKKQSYRYSLSPEGVNLGRALLANEQVNTSTSGIEQVKQEIKISDKFERDMSLRTDLAILVERETIHACENNIHHEPIVIPSGDRYFEGHHVIPNSKSSKSRGLDTEKMGNYVALCPMCHAAVHHGNEEWAEPVLINLIKIPRVYKYLSSIFKLTSEDDILSELKKFY